MSGSAQAVVTGVGVVSGIGADVAAFSESLRHGRGSISRSSETGAIASVIEDAPYSSRLDALAGLPSDVVERARRVGTRAPRCCQLAIVSALQACAQSRLWELDAARVGVVVAGHAPNRSYLAREARRFAERGLVSPNYALHFMDTDLVGSVSEVLGCTGEGFSVGGASASGNVGLIHAARALEADLDACLVIGYLAELTDLERGAFANLGSAGGKRFAEWPERACRPFDKGAEGFIHGEASACVVLERKACAKARHAEVLSCLVGTAMALHGSRGPSPDRRGEVMVLRKALASAGVRHTDVDYVNAHATSTPLGDETEARALEDVFGEHASRLWVNATKGLTGHCLWSAGVVEAIASIVQLREGFVHANLNLEEPIDAACRFVGAHREQARIRIAVSNSFGFGGINTTIVLAAP